MNKKKIFWETFLAGIIVLAIFIASGLTVYFSSKSYTENELTSSLKVAEAIFDGTNAETTGEKVASAFSTEKDSLRVSIITRGENNTYTILYDSKGMTETGKVPEELNSPDTFVTRESAYGYGMVYLATKDRENPIYYVRVSLRESETTELARNFLIYGSIAYVVLFGSLVAYQIVQYNKVVAPMQSQIQELARLSGADSSSLNKDNDLEALTYSAKRLSSLLSDRMEALKKEQEKVQTIVNSISQGFLGVSREGRIELLNRAGAEIFDVEQSVVMHQNFHVLLAGEKFNHYVEEAMASNSSEEPFDWESGGKIYSVSVMRLEDEWGSAQGGVAVLLLDVTGERGAARIKSDFFANASHELKSPLTSVLGYQEMIRAGILKDPKDLEEANNATIREAKRMKDILSDMLTLNKLEREGEAKKLVPLDVGQEMENALTSLAPQMAARSIDLESHLSHWTVKADQEDLAHLFVNLLDNAVKYNKVGGKVTVKMDGKKKSIEISDTGIGIKEEDLPKIFERFYRVDNSRVASNVEGSGLGLAIVKHIVEFYHWSIKVNSTFGKGTSFVLVVK